MFKPALIATLFLGSAVAAGCGGPRHHGPIDQARMDRQITEHLDDYLDDVKASDAQRARIATVKKQLLPQGVDLANAQQQVNREIAQQLASDRPDRARLHALVDQQVDATRAFAHKSIDGVLEAHGTLTAEQRTPLTRKLQRFASR